MIPQTGYQLILLLFKLTNQERVRAACGLAINKAGLSNGIRELNLYIKNGLLPLLDHENTNIE